MTAIEDIRADLDAIEFLSSVRPIFDALLYIAEVAAMTLRAPDEIERGKRLVDLKIALQRLNDGNFTSSFKEER